MPASSSVPAEFALLVSAFAAITDPRFARGKVHPLPGVLALVVLGLMGGCRSLSAISRYGQIHPEVLAPLGLLRSPSVATLHRLLRRVSVAEVRTALAEFTRRLLAARTGDPRVGVAAVDGKTLRGVWEGAVRPLAAAYQGLNGHSAAVQSRYPPSSDAVPEAMPSG